LNWRFWILVLVVANEFWQQLNFCIGQQLFAAAIIKTNWHIPARFPLQPRWYVLVSVYFCTFCAIFQCDFWRTAVVCYTFHHCCTTAFVSSVLFIAVESIAIVQPRL